MAGLVRNPELAKALERYDRADPGEVHDMARALDECRRYLTNFGSIDPNALVQQIDDALAMYELREAAVNAALAKQVEV